MGKISYPVLYIQHQKHIFCAQILWGKELLVQNRPFSYYSNRVPASIGGSRSGEARIFPDDRILSIQGDIGIFETPAAMLNVDARIVPLLNDLKRTNQMFICAFQRV